MAARGGGLMLSASTSVDLVLFEAIARTHFTEGRGNPNLLVGNRQITFYGESLDASLVLHAGARLDDGSARHLLQAFLPQSHSGICCFDLSPKFTEGRRNSVYLDPRAEGYTCIGLKPVFQQFLGFLLWVHHLSLLDAWTPAQPSGSFRFSCVCA